MMNLYKDTIIVSSYIFLMDKIIFIIDINR